MDDYEKTQHYPERPAYYIDHRCESSQDWVSDDRETSDVMDVNVSAEDVNASVEFIDWLDNHGFHCQARALVGCCASAVEFTEENHHRFAKRIVCRRHFCPECSKKDSEAHRLRYSSLFQKLLPFKEMGYYVLTIPENLQRELLAEGRLKALHRLGWETLKEILGIEAAITSLHFFGGVKERLNIHLNVLFPILSGSYLLPVGKLKEVRCVWRLKLEKLLGVKIPEDQENANYQYVTRKGRQIHKIRYVSRSTMPIDKLMKEDEDVRGFLVGLVGFRNIRGFGLLSDRNWKQFVAEYQQEPVQEKKPFECPICQAKLKAKGILSISDGMDHWFDLRDETCLRADLATYIDYLYHQGKSQLEIFNDLQDEHGLDPNFIADFLSMWFHAKGYNFQQKFNYTFGGDFMETVDIELEDLEKWTSLEKAVEIYNDQETFLKYKRDRLYGALDEQEQLHIFSDLRELMTKAAEGKFAEGDFDRLESYRNLDSGALHFAPQLSRISIPIEIYRDPEGQIKGVDLHRLGIELDKRLFQQVFEVLVGRKKVGVCAAEDCRRVFIPKGTGYEQIYHSSRCKVRVGMRNTRARKRKQT